MKKVIEKIIFSTRWILPIFYFILILALFVYVYVDVKEFIEYLSNFAKLNKETAMLTFIELIDMTMIANLGKMVISGSYNSFVSKTHGYPGENISSGLLKVKMSTSLVGVTAIGLLQRSVDVQNVSWDTLYKLGFIHGLFLCASIILQVVDYLHCKSELYHLKAEELESKSEKIKEKNHH